MKMIDKLAYVADELRYNYILNRTVIDAGKDLASSADNNDFRIKLKKLERTLKGLGISLEMLDGLAENLTMENVMDMIEMAERKR